MTASTTTHLDTVNAAPVIIDGKVFTVEVTTHRWVDHLRGDLACEAVSTYLRGQRGALYLCRGFLRDSTGLAEVVSVKSGAPLRDRCQRPVRVLVLGDVVEQVAPR